MSPFRIVTTFLILVTTVIVRSVSSFTTLKNEHGRLPVSFSTRIRPSFVPKNEIHSSIPKVRVFPIALSSSSDDTEEDFEYTPSEEDAGDENDFNYDYPLEEPIEDTRNIFMDKIYEYSDPKYLDDDSDDTEYEEGTVFYPNPRLKDANFDERMNKGVWYPKEKSDIDEFDDENAVDDEPKIVREYYDEPDVNKVHKPLSMSKNSGNRFVSFVFDRTLNECDDDQLWKLHEDRIALSDEHVFFCRKANLYNETFNAESMTDVPWSHQLLSTDLQRTVGHVMCMDSTTCDHAREHLSSDPIVKMLTGGDISKIPFYRWRHIRDSTLRQDDGLDGTPIMLVAMDRDASLLQIDNGDGKKQDLRKEKWNDHLEYLIRSERIIACGPLHVATDDKTDPKSVRVGEIIMCNALTREDAIKFVENSPYSKAGVYDSMRLFRYNKLDVTGKFCQPDLLYPENTRPCGEMKDSMDREGYPTDDQQTPWLNW